MPLYTPKFSKEGFKGGKNILASEHTQFIEAGATLDGDAFTDDFYDVGTVIARNTTTGKFEPLNGDEGAEELEGFDNVGILNVDFETSGNDVIAGEVIVRGSVYEAKLPYGNISDEIKAKMPMVRFVNHI